ncbi:Pyruvate kinase [Fulvivirga imtechensis AK7]|uniref:Pyruvate kinase n=1 Tax=Fulvivirga imtechensis AK7 TaxID=1237149 RepID=L8JU86_9BACT|nr:pyruvate kinase [Fulvivirga imtechensis]ELR72335.1 Pyruvate kinase [Fulvivirga imtechensis AK7]
MDQKIKFNKTKIIATVGPASNEKEMLRKLIKEGVDIFRLNFSHGTHADHEKVVQYVRELNDEMDTHVCLLQDLQGPKIRVGEVESGAKLKAGQIFTITTEEVVGNSERASTVYQDLPKDVGVGDMVLIDDGKIELKVKEINATEVITEVVHGGKLKSRKGINMPYTKVSAPSLTDKDIKDLEFGLKHEVEWIALSFVRTADDIHNLRKRITDAGRQSKIVAKVEKPEAIRNIDGIIEATDAVMVARGDLGVEIFMEEVPMAQKMIVRKCNKLAKPVIIATQMMESMIENPRPTRAETNDVANAVMDGADALMLSAETAAGAFPVQVIRSMVKTITSVEREADVYFKHDLPEQGDPLFYNNTLVLAACRLAKASRAKAIIGMTQSGYTAFKLSSHRPKANIFIFTSNRPLLNTINLIWGVRGYYYDKEVSTDDTFADIEQILKERGHINPGDAFITTASMPIHARGRTNTVKLNVVE